MDLGVLLHNGTDLALDMLDRSRYLFYLPNPYETMFSDMNVPRYITKLFPVIVLIAFLENGVRILRGMSILRMNDSVASLASGLFQDCLRLNIRSVEVICFSLVYENYRLTTLPWDSLYTWLLCAILVDWGFYWAHRLSHEITFIWAVHQAHHSGEDFTILTAFRQALLQPFTAWVTYMPLAILGIPPPIFLTHLQLTELYMIWIHTEAVKSLGPLEYILCCPSHHRVHHGRNRQYIDKNYGGVLIIWDRLFGTFEDEDPEEPVVYGLVHPVESYNIFWLQFHSWVAMFRNMYHAEGWHNKLLIPFKGPGWSPGKPRLGYLDEIPELQYPVSYYDPQISLLEKVYVIWHFIIVILFYEELSLSNHELSQGTLLISVSAILTSLTSIGFILEKKSFALQVEMLRCLIFFMVEQYLTPLGEIGSRISPVDSSFYRNLAGLIIRLTFLTSAIFCAICELSRMSLKALDKMKAEMKGKLL